MFPVPIRSWNNAQSAYICVIPGEASDILLIPFQESDASIRKRALELVYLLVNENNVKLLTKDLIDYLEISDQEFKGDLTARICSIVEK